MNWLSCASIAAFLMLASALPASADHLSWSRKATVAKDQATCLGFGERAFNRLGIHMEKKGQHFDAKQGGALIVYTCVQTTAIIMVVSRDGGEADRLRAAIEAELAKEKPL